MTEEYVKARDLAAMFNVSRPSIYYWIKRGYFPEGRIIGGVRRWTHSEIKAWLSQQAKTQKGVYTV